MLVKEQETGVDARIKGQFKRINCKYLAPLEEDPLLALPKLFDWYIATRPPLSPVAKNSPVESNSTADITSAVFKNKTSCKIYVCDDEIKLDYCNNEP